MSHNQGHAELREDLITNAVEFLQDKTIADSSLTKKIQFIESKGLTEAEVEEAIHRAQNGDYTTPSSSASLTTTTKQSESLTSPKPPLPDYYYAAPPLPERDWKDYFIMATATAGVSYGLYQILKRYIVPKVLPPSKSQLEKDKDAIDREFMRVEQLLEKFESEQQEFYKQQEAKTKKLDDVIVEVENIIKNTNDKNLHNEEVLKYLKLEVDSIKTTLMKSLDDQKTTINTELSSLGNQMDSLKADLQELKKVREASENSIAASSPASNSQSGNGNDNPHSATIPVKQPNKTTEAKPNTEQKKPSYANLNIPPVSSIPSAKDILSSSSLSASTPANSESTTETNNSNSSENTASSDNGSGVASGAGTSRAGIPAWQQSAPSSGKSGIPAWQLNNS
ncbi:unnamed protein product [Ambrosiozyma monospora]|uniref:Peroxisomal membrane protein PEX14 n=1 Tax=Ambrosiozyma monospora TaxID=43982 RepID=A0A9W7DC41_AMBMO|nr:unnamed protein product [Ambrosiozyma monospora]